MSMSMAERDDAQPATGILELPSGLMHALITRLHAKDRLSLFSVCKQLAMQLATSAHVVTLQFYKQAPEDAVEVRSGVAGELLSLGRNLRLKVQARGSQPFPPCLYGKVTHMFLAYSQNGPTSPWLEWGAFSNLQSLHMAKYITQADLDVLCSALEAGHLQQLEELELLQSTDEDWGGKRSIGQFVGNDLNFERLACALGLRIKCLRTDSDALLQHIFHLNALQKVYLSTKTSAHFRAMCKHTTVQSVTIKGYKTVCDDISQCPCQWHSLHIVQLRRPGILLCLPLLGLQQLNIAGSVSNRDNGLDFVTDKHLNKLFLSPMWDVWMERLHFMVDDITVSTIPLLSRLEGGCWLYLRWQQCHQPGPPQGPAFLHSLWATLPHSTSFLQLNGISGMDWPTFWVGIPKHVTCLEINSPEFGTWNDHHLKQAETMCNMVASTPEHITELTLFGVRHAYRYNWEAAGIYKLAPPHVKVKVTNLLSIL